ncbi:MAG: phosphotransferase [Sphingopyxis sp.]|uniref:phosphotransferase n=1 Tax=Sphingobium sp. TaxID=1912891 RepID=UPI001A35C98A|nr:phosphotransferase [Sphingobium sp.]MBJ7442151.1 phosphotransferase [Sphingopyxis sp.]
MSTQTASMQLDDFDGLIDWEKLKIWLSNTEALKSVSINSVSKLAGGLQNNVFLLKTDRQDFVLRRPRKHLKPKSNETILREARVLRALNGSAVPHPSVLATCDDETVIGACFYLMEPLEGFAKSGDLPGDYALQLDPRTRAADLAS